jgi:hypothetical protein
MTWGAKIQIKIFESFDKDYLSRDISDFLSEKENPPIKIEVQRARMNSNEPWIAIVYYWEWKE